VAIDLKIVSICMRSKLTTVQQLPIAKPDIC